jgi:hypothetical protein
VTIKVFQMRSDDMADERKSKASSSVVYARSTSTAAAGARVPPRPVV